jgi:phosphoribosylanthranilate isomerase
MIRVKICGVTTLADGLAAARAGADLLGLNFYPPSPRSLPVEQAQTLASGLRDALGAGCPVLVGVFVNEPPDSIRRVVAAVGLDAAQLSGDEPPDVVAALPGVAYKAIRPRSLDEALQLAAAYLLHAPIAESLPALLLDAYHPDLYGGTGEQASSELARAVAAFTTRLMLAGGLTPGNVGARAAALRPWGVDVASGVEDGTPGRKDVDKMRAFVEAVKTR